MPGHDAQKRGRGMRTLIVYDSKFGNTEEVARTIARGLGDDASVVHADGVDADALGEYELLIVGSPTQAGRPTPLVQAFLRRIPDGSLQGVDVTGFDTRIRGEGLISRFFIGVLGFAAGRIARRLEAKGGHLVAHPAGFIVEDKEGPLAGGEADRAAAWGDTILHAHAANR
jgi:flavodoxin I